MIIKPDVIVCWPRNCDYPLWRRFISKNRQLFNKVIVAFTGSPEQNDYDHDVRLLMENDQITFIDMPVNLPGDWRDNATRRALTHSTSEWVWFTEQDFYVTNEFFNDVDRFICAKADVFAVYQGSRMHPCSILTKRSILDELKLDFGIEPDLGDHFCKIQRQLENGDYTIFRVNPRTYEHLNGLSSNWYLLTHGGLPNYEPVRFEAYLRECLTDRVLITGRFKKTVLDGIKRLERNIVVNA